MSLKKNTHCGKNKLTGQYETVKNSIKEKTAERDAIKNDFSVLENFRKDEGFCPPESYTPEELPTNKPCGKIVEELKSLIVSLGKDTENFKKSINLFNSNFTARNTFSFLSHCRVIPITWILHPIYVSLWKTIKLPNTRTA